MAKIYERSLFSWRDLPDLGDLERLKLVFDNLPDEKLMDKLNEKRGNGRNDYPVRAVWNSILAGIVYQHKSITSLRRDLLRNAQMRELCGFSQLKGRDAVPSDASYSNFLSSLLEESPMITEMFDGMVDELKNILDGFGSSLAVDGKAIKSFAKKKRRPPKPIIERIKMLTGDERSTTEKKKMGVSGKK